VVETYMDSAVLDTSVVVKSILELPRSLPLKVYRREVETRRKIRYYRYLVKAW